ncbi:MAG: type II secretion system protein [Bryobacterales bacterium]|nr:type II secretion system protein [Bryobacterales bacterium]
MSRRQRPRGVTLIELLIAITLVSLLATGLLFAMRVGINAMESANRRVMTNRKTLGAHRILEQQVAGFMPVPVQCRTQNGQPGGKMPLFQGAAGVMRFVSSYSLQEASRGIPRILEYFIIAGDQGLGVRLVVNEIPYTGPVGAGMMCSLGPPDPASGGSIMRFPQPEARRGTFVLADRLAMCRFWYEEPPPPGTPPQVPTRWVPIWKNAGEWPRSIRIEMAPLDQDPSRVQPMTFTAPVHITRQPGDASEIKY